MVVLSREKIHQKTGSTSESTVEADKVGVKRGRGDKRSRGGVGWEGVVLEHGFILRNGRVRISRMVHCCSEKKYYILCVFVALGIQHSMRIYAILLSLACPALQYLSHFSQTTRCSTKKLLNTKYVF
jgi:hypothetical protein